MHCISRITSEKTDITNFVGLRKCKHTWVTRWSFWIKMKFRFRVWLSCAFCSLSFLFFNSHLYRVNVDQVPRCSALFGGSTFHVLLFRCCRFLRRFSSLNVWYSSHITRDIGDQCLRQELRWTTAIQSVDSRVGDDEECRCECAARAYNVPSDISEALSTIHFLLKSYVRNRITRQLDRAARN